MRFHQLRHMGFEEIAVRGRQQAAKWLDRNGAVLSRPTRRGPGPAMGTAPHQTASDPVASHPFFDAAGSAELPALLTARMPEARQAALAGASATGHGRFNLLGYASLSFGAPIDWHLDPVSGRRVPPVHWSLIDALDHGTNGDSKVIWELNRHQWLVQLGQAYRLTGDERCAERFAATIEAWLQANPPGMGINWASSLEVSFRLIAWCWCLRLFQGSRALSPRLGRLLLEGIGTHAAHVERFLSTYFSPNTHLTGEALGLFYAGVLLPGTPHAQRWRALGERILIEQCDRHVLPDGVYFEQATGYQRYTLEFYLHFLILGAAAGRPAPPAVTSTVHRMLDFLVALRRPDGSLPQIGDADSGSLLPLTPRAQDDFRGVFAIAAALLGRADCAWAAGGAAPELLWLLGPAGLAAFDAIRPEPPKAPPSRHFADGGYVVMQDGWATDRHQLTLDTGPLGCSVTSGHGHADLLSIQCAVFGEPYLVDAGTFLYTGDPASRAFFRGTTAHSTVVVDGQPQAVSTGPFRWSARPKAALRTWQSTPHLDYADAEYTACAGRDSTSHDGAGRHGASRNGTSRDGAITHRRRVGFVKSRYWLIVDDLTGNGDHAVDVRFQFAPMEVSLCGAGRALARGRTGGGLLVQSFSSAPLQATVWTGSEAPMQGWTSSEYGRREPAPALVYSTTAGLPLRILTILLPMRDGMAALPALTPLVDQDGSPRGVRFEDGEQVLVDNLGVHAGPSADFPPTPL